MLFRLLSIKTIISNRFKIKIPKVLYNKYKNLTKHNNGYRNVFNNDCTDYIDLNTDIYDLNLLWYKIKSIEYINEDNVYDIETETHNFIGNSISLHNCNIQNITKPHVTSHYCVPEEAVKQYYPEIWEALDNSGTREECRTPLRYLDIEKINQLCKDNNIENYTIPEGATRWSYRIYGWVFSEEPWLIPGVEEFVVEGFIQDQNIRSTFLPDDNHYWVSCLSLDTLVEIETGEKVPITFFKDAENRKNHKIKTLTKYTTVSAYMDRGIKKKCTLITESGLSLDCTEDHKILVIDNDGNETWKELKDITTDDYIISNIGGDSND